MASTRSLSQITRRMETHERGCHLAEQRRIRLWEFFLFARHFRIIVSRLLMRMILCVVELGTCVSRRLACSA